MAGARSRSGRQEARRRGNAIPPYLWAPDSFKRLLGGCATLGLSRFNYPPSILAHQAINEAPGSTPLFPKRGRRDPGDERAVLLQLEYPDGVRDRQRTIRCPEHVTVRLPRIVGELLSELDAKTLSVMSVDLFAADSVGARALEEDALKPVGGLQGVNHFLLVCWRRLQGYAASPEGRIYRRGRRLIGEGRSVHDGRGTPKGR